MVQTIVTEQKETDVMLLQKVNNLQLQMRASTPASGFACMLWEVCVMMEKKGGLSQAGLGAVGALVGGNWWHD